MATRQRWLTTISLYVNYIVYGMAIVILAQNMASLGHQWHVDTAEVSYVISSLGIGHLLVLYVAGVLSDRWGRKLFVNLGILTYLPFFIGIVFCRSTTMAYVLGVLAGMANSFLDAGTYPTLMELHPRHEASANILIKAFSSVGELSLPLIVAALDGARGWYGWSFMLGAVILIANLIFLQWRQFPARQRATTATVAQVAKPVRWRTTQAVILTIFGYVGMATFYLISQWLTEYGTDVVHLSLLRSRLLVSVYSAGSILGVLLTALVVNRWLKPTWFMLVDTVVSLLALIAMAAVPVFGVMFVGSLIIGISATGGVLQIGLTLMSDLYPAHKGRVLGIYYTASGLASFTIPLVTGGLAKTSIHQIMWFDVGVAVLGVLCAVAILMLKRAPQSVGQLVDD
ncbi:MFS transporter [Levilactobacillus acidifarinae]|uniref:MFS transporter n=1 Tax=Levilactobacillus acidifarinae TaxID=267364 RepID=UPI0007111D41|nr:MFS transporter [Levilactobacillus acidifarinae]GEO69128.1 MFS transporter [Levilactobacillus acidifarinae]